MRNSLRLPRTIAERLIRQALAEAPRECCGLLAGRAFAIESVYPLVNESSQPEKRYHVGAGLFAPFKEMRRRGEKLLAIYHSHPTGQAVPSGIDREENYYGPMHHLIIGLSPKPHLRAWLIMVDRVEEQGLQLDDANSTG